MTDRQASERDELRQATPESVLPADGDPAMNPVPLWPDGAVALAAIAVLGVVAYRHRHYLRRRAEEIHRTVDEFQRQGGIEDLTQVARQAAEFLRGKS